MRLKNRYRQWRIKHLRKRLETLHKQYEWAYSNKELLGEIEYEKYTDIVAGQMVNAERALTKLGEII